MRRTIILILAFPFLLSLLLAQPVRAENVAGSRQPPAEVITAAESGLRTFQTVTTANPLKWGFTDSATIQETRLGDGFEIQFIDPTVVPEGSAVRLLDLVDISLHSTWLFTIDLHGEPRTFLTVCRMDGGTYQFAGFGGDATYLGIALDAFHARAGLSAQPVLLQFREELFLLWESEGSELVLPIPRDAASANNVRSGEGFVPAYQVIRAIRASVSDSAQKGTTFANVWDDPQTISRDVEEGRLRAYVFLGCLLTMLLAALAPFLYDAFAKRR